MANEITRPTAAELNAHLADGGAVQVTTYTRSTVYEAKHEGWFSESTHGDLRVKHGRRTVALSVGQVMSVGLRLGRFVEKS